MSRWSIMRRDAAPALMILVLVAGAGCFGNGGSNEPVATDTVRIPGAWVFEPKVIEVEANTTVTWTNDGGQDHTVTIEALGVDQVVEPDGVVRFTFDGPGTYDYVCRFHPPDMVGQVIVREEPVESG